MILECKINQTDEQKLLWSTVESKDHFKIKTTHDLLPS